MTMNIALRILLATVLVVFLAALALGGYVKMRQDEGRLPK